MATTVTIKVDGLADLRKQMLRLKEDVATKIAGRATNAAAQIVKKQAKTNIQISPSVDEGDLLKAVIVKKIPKSKTPLTSEHIVTVRGRGRRGAKARGGKAQATAPHAHFVEFGTVNMPAEPFLRPALEQEKGFAVGAMKQTLIEGIQKATRK